MRAFIVKGSWGVDDYDYYICITMNEESAKRIMQECQEVADELTNVCREKGYDDIALAEAKEIDPQIEYDMGTTYSYREIEIRN